MKTRKVLILPFILIILLITFIPYMIKPSKIKKIDISKDISITEKLLTSDIIVFGKSTISFTEEEVNSLLVPLIEKEISKSNLPSYIKYNGLYIDLKKNKALIKTDISLYKLPVGLNIYTKVFLKNNIVYIKLTNVFLGRIPISLYILKKLMLNESDLTFNLNIKELDKITIKDITITENNLNIKFIINKDTIINFLDKLKEDIK
ncbi:MAG: hypothetical protein FH753_11365 [Firmicutes bacterium]|nr:hypothetical protein [Bacillota bacterium]